MQLVVKGLDLNVIVNPDNEKLHLKPGTCNCSLKGCDLKTCPIIS